MNRRRRGFLSVVAFLMMVYTLLDILNLYYDTLRVSQQQLDIGMALDQMVYIESNIANSYWGVVDQSFGLAYGADMREGVRRYPVADALFTRERFFLPCEIDVDGLLQNATRRNLLKWARATAVLLRFEGKEVNITVDGADGDLTDLADALTLEMDRSDCGSNGCCDITFPFTNDTREPPVSDIDARYGGHDLCTDEWPGCPAVPTGLPSDFCMAISPCEVYEDAQTLAQYYSGIGHSAGSLAMSNLFGFTTACPDCIDHATGQTLSRDIRFPKCPESASPACRAMEGFAQNVGRGMGLAFLSSCPYGKWHDITVGVPVRSYCSRDSRDIDWPGSDEDKRLLGPSVFEDGVVDDERVESMVCSGYDIFDACGGAGLLDTPRQTYGGQRCCLCNDTSPEFTTTRICLSCNNTVDLTMMDELDDQLHLNGTSWDRERVSLFEDPVVDDTGIVVERTCRMTTNTCNHFTIRTSLPVRVDVSLADDLYRISSSFEMSGRRRIGRRCSLRRIDWAAMEAACRVLSAVQEVESPTMYQVFVGLDGTWTDYLVSSGVPNVVLGFNYTDGSTDVNASALGPPALIGALIEAIVSNRDAFSADGNDYHFIDVAGSAPAGVQARCQPGNTCRYRSLESGLGGGIAAIGPGLLAREDSDDIRALLLRNETDRDGEQFWVRNDPAIGYDVLLEPDYVDNILSLTFDSPSLTGLGGVGAPDILTRGKDCEWTAEKEECMRHMLRIFYGPFCRWGVDPVG